MKNSRKRPLYTDKLQNKSNPDEALLVLSKINYARYSTEIFYQFMLTFRHICKYITKKYSKSSAEQHQKLFTSQN
jgi:hypothetical protein